MPLLLSFSSCNAGTRAVYNEEAAISPKMDAAEKGNQTPTVSSRSFSHLKLPELNIYSYFSQAFSYFTQQWLL